MTLELTATFPPRGLEFQELLPSGQLVFADFVQMQRRRVDRDQLIIQLPILQMFTTNNCY